MPFVKLTDASGQAVWIAAQWVTKVAEIRKGEYTASARALVTMGGSTQAVMEAATDVLKLLEAANDGAAGS